MYLIWGCQGAHTGLCDSLDWQGEDFAYSASFLIFNEIMLPGRARCSRRPSRSPGTPAVWRRTRYIILLATKVLEGTIRGLLRVLFFTTLISNRQPDTVIIGLKGFAHLNAWN